jgi:hypothetical protein
MDDSAPRTVFDDMPSRGVEAKGAEFDHNGKLKKGPSRKRSSGLRRGMPFVTPSDEDAEHLRKQVLGEIPWDEAPANSLSEDGAPAPSTTNVPRRPQRKALFAADPNGQKEQDKVKEEEVPRRDKRKHKSKMYFNRPDHVLQRLKKTNFKMLSYGGASR